MNNYDYRVKVDHPWQSGPTDLIAHALEHLHKDTDFDQRIAFYCWMLALKLYSKRFYCFLKRLQP